MPTRLRDCASAEAELAARVDVLGWAAGGWAEGHLRRCGDLAVEPWVLLPGVTTLARLVARLWAQVSPIAGSVPESVVNASSLVFQGWADDVD